ncbi:MAG TPA: hydantoinase/oxoprolinase family protein [Candidatus Acidoferrales bacterium]|nr:hydantoinase/oxoprolinase family protein [Candidatus Acidoferrales bacterium]
MAAPMRIAMDTGGTFTDCLFLDRGRIEILKLPSTPANPARAIQEALASILSPSAQHRSAALDLLCGTTVGTNALLERRGGRAALVTTAGFEDVLEIGRQARPRLFDLFVDRPEPLVPAARRLGLRERVGAEGQILARPSASEIARIVRQLRRMRAESVAVCFLFSFLRPEHERMVAKRLRAAGFSVSASHEILPEFREFERASTTAMNAYLVPVMSHYLMEIERHARFAAGKPRRTGNAGRDDSGARVRIMQSNGGTVSAALAAREPVRTILSGPAGGVLGAQRIAALSGFSRIISFDMGGTSTDVSLIEGDRQTTNESSIAGLPVAVPMLEVHTVGAGGGSIARFDRGGALRVGPESAGADPGPICYGRGERPTVTDAHLILGRLGAEGLLGGGFHLDAGRARAYMERAARGARGIASLVAFAEGIVAVVEATMEKAIRVISVERGRDPRDYALVAFGGAGGLHACALAEKLSMPQVLIPQFPGALSALGILCADVVKDASRTVLLPMADLRDSARALRREFAGIEREGAATMRAEGFAPGRWRVDRFLDMRYVGQAYELSVPAGRNFIAAFHREHERRYGYSDTSRPVEIVNVRARFTAATERITWPRERLGRADCAKAIVSVRNVYFGGRRWRTPIYDREGLHAGNRMRGPAVIAEYSATTIVPPGWEGRVDRHRNLVLGRGQP